MFRTLILSNVVGAITAVLGWTTAVLLLVAMDDATFASLRFGWGGLMIGSVAIVALFMLLALSDIVEPVMTLVAACAVSAALWNRQELPLSSNTNLTENTPGYYWATITMMAIILGLLFLGLRGARVSTQRARGL